MLGFGRVKLRADADVLAWISPTAWHDPMGGVVGGDVGLDWRRKGLKWVYTLWGDLERQCSDHGYFKIKKFEEREGKG